MGRTVKNRSEPHLKPVERIELSERNPKGRLAAVILLLVVGVAALVYAFVSFFSADAGWTRIEASGEELSCADEFVFWYQLGAGDVSPRTELRALTSIYTQAAETAYRLFTNDVGYEGVSNIYYINRHPNEVLKVEEPLYRAFSLVEGLGSRYLYLAPVYSRYDNIFYCNDDSQLADFDPFLNAEIAEEYAEMAAYAKDPQSVRLELLGDLQVRLYVSEEYLAYAKTEGVEDFIDFYWMKNAFIADYLAEVMISNGCTLGSISSYDGFVRNLDWDSGAPYSFDLYDREKTDIYPAAVMEYTGALSIVSLRDYPMSSLDFRHYYELRDGQIRIPYLDIADGMPRAAEDSLVCYCAEKGCAEILLRVIPVYIAQELQSPALAELSREGIDSVWSENAVIRYTDESLILTDLYRGEDREYKAELFSDDTSEM